MNGYLFSQYATKRTGENKRVHRRIGIAVGRGLTVSPTADLDSTGACPYG